jgi:peptidyl-prolyl cis-trans isomerase B (cyclophilin B)
MALYALFDTDRGPIKVELYPDKAPLTVANFVNLAKRGFYDGLNFHRVIPDFMIQGGCPEGSGRGGPGYKFEDETNNGVKHERGVLSMANAGPNTNGSQFFITHIKTDWLDGKHTVFGKVVEGIEVVDAVKQGDGIKSVKIEGDADAALAAKADRVAEWNKIRVAHARIAFACARCEVIASRDPAPVGTHPCANIFHRHFGPGERLPGLSTRGPRCPSSHGASVAPNPARSCLSPKPPSA